MDRKLTQFSLPQELIDTLIDWVQFMRENSDDPLEFTSTLQSCSLVCKSFLPRARKYLFHDITLRSNPGDQTLDGFKQRIQPLLEFEDSGLSREVMALVRKLTICEGPFTRTNWVLKDTIHRLLPFGQLPFTTLKEIELGSSRARSSYEVDAASLSELLKNNFSLESLRLIGVSLNSRSELIHILSSLSRHTHFHRLGLVSIHIQQYTDTDVMMNTPFDDRPRLTTLEYRNPDDRLLDDLFFDPRSLFDISELKELDLSTQMKPIPARASEEGGNCSKILACCPESLTSLCLDIRDFLFTGLTTMNYLQHVTELRRLELRGLNIRHGWTHQIAFILTLLSALPRGLHHLSLHAEILDWHVLEQFQHLDSALSALPESLPLKEIRIVLERFGRLIDKETDIEKITNCFPKTRERGISIAPERGGRR